MRWETAFQAVFTSFHVSVAIIALLGAVYHAMRFSEARRHW